MISQKAYLMGRDEEYLLTIEFSVNRNDLLKRVNDLSDELKLDLNDDDISSGWRPGKYNKLAGGSKNSCHLICMAIDIKDEDGILAGILVKNIHLLEKYGLYMENPYYTKGWVHLQTRPTHNRIFIPK